MVTIQTLREPDFTEVKRMIDVANGQIGNVLIEAVDCDTYLLALNNSDANDLEAARVLGIIPQVRVHARTDRLLPAAYDWFSFAEWTKDDATDEDEDNKAPPRRHYLAGEIADRLELDPASAWVFEFGKIEIQD